MKRLVALILVCIICMTTAYAAEWAEGLSPAKPSNLKPEVDLTQTVGYWLMYPRAGLTADRFCDVLEIYMPNPDIQLGEGTATLWNADGKVAVLDFTDPVQVELRDMAEIELERMHWGCGICVEMHLPVSLKFGEQYYVTMDEGALVTNGGKVKSFAIPYSDKVPLEEQYWTPIVSGDYGISGLCYSVAPEQPEAAETEEGAEEGAEQPAEEPAEDDTPVEPKYNPGKGDRVTFDLVLGGDAVVAVMDSQNDSVTFKTVEYSESGRVTGLIKDDDMDWGVVFLNEAGEVVDYVHFQTYEDEEAATEGE